MRGGTTSRASSERVPAVRERAPAKVNLLLHVGPRRADGLHELCSIFASIALADEVVVTESGGAADTVVCPEVEEPNICSAALEVFRGRTGLIDDRTVGDGRLPPLEVRIDKRIPVAAGLGGGSADAAAVLRAANELAGRALDVGSLRELAAEVGADVPSQVDPHHALVTGAGEVVEPIDLPPMHLVLVPLGGGLSTADVYREADRIGATRGALDAEAVRSLAGRPLPELAASLENDLQAAATSLRPEIDHRIGTLRETAALAALVTGSGPTAFGLFEREEEAKRAAAGVPEAIVTSTT